VAEGLDALIRAARGAGTYDLVVATKDWHVDPGDHFARPGQTPDYRVTWPVHCVAGTDGARLHPPLDDRMFDSVFCKGRHAASYSGFEGSDDAGRDLARYLRDHRIDAVDVAGIATDYCVKATAIDAATAGFATRVLDAMCAAVDPGEGAAAARQAMRDAGAEVDGGHARDGAR
jgi:nicotinamidase/pyrazinamidase